jgi:hypothetical protein
VNLTCEKNSQGRNVVRPDKTARKCENGALIDDRVIFNNATATRKLRCAFNAVNADDRGPENN